MSNAGELYKLEYEQAAERYENIYKAVWANFNYLTILSGGIYAFGARVFPLEVTAFLAVLPLLFWWLAIFEPMNRYGSQVEKRLCEIEKILNSLNETDLIKPFTTDPADPAAGAKVTPPADVKAKDYGLRHYSQFVERRTGKLTFRGLIAGLFSRPRTRYWIRLVIPLLLVVTVLYAALSSAGVIPKRQSSGDIAVIGDGTPNAPVSRVAGVDMQMLKEAAEKNPKLREDLNGLNKSLETLSNDVKQRLNEDKK